MITRSRLKNLHIEHSEDSTKDSTQSDYNCIDNREDLQKNSVGINEAVTKDGIETMLRKMVVSFST